MIAIVDYGVGNLFSLRSSCAKIGVEAVVTGDADVIKKADGIILPGVGAFRDAISKLRQTGLDKVVKEECSAQKPLLGICLGMQMLFDRSFEGGEYEGLGLIPGNVKPIKDVIPANYKVPHIGWNKLVFKQKSPLFKYINEGDFVYFVHSFYASDCEKNTSSVTEYGYPLTASVENGIVFGCQFHPEKSGEVGLKILRAYAGIAEGRIV